MPSDILLALLRSALTGVEPECSCSPDEWAEVYAFAVKQCVVGLAYQGVSRLPASKCPPHAILMRWARNAEAIKGHNQLLNDISARLTTTFAAEGFRSAILKGPANARLYPCRFARQCGDIDIWVEGGRQKVVDLLQSLGLFKAPPKISWLDYKAYRKSLRENISVTSPHHIHLKQTIDGVMIEVHFKPSSGNFNPFANKRLQLFLEQEIEKSVNVAEGFCVPSVKFALVMQLSHIQHHFITEGVGLKQLVDYYVLLQKASDDERAEVSALLHRFGMYRTATALMGLLKNIFGLEDQEMLCTPNYKLGDRFLRDVLNGGVFGCVAERKKHGFLMEWISYMFLPFQLFWLDPIEVFWSVVAKWIGFLRSISIRLRARKLVVRTLFQKDDTIATM